MPTSLHMTKAAQPAVPSAVVAATAAAAAAAAASAETVSAERRTHRRTRTFLVATVNYGRLLLPCFIVDISTGGAKVKLLEPARLAEGACVVECGRFGKVPADVVWQRGLFAGFRFAEGQAPRNVASLSN